MASKDIIFASGNQNKIIEVQAMLGEAYRVRGLRDVGITEEIAETATTLEGNASIKSRYIFDKMGCDCFSDDTGLEVEILNGAPGVQTARYGGESKNDDDNIALLLKNMEGETNRNCRFVTVVSLIKDGQEYFFEGEVRGTIRTSRSGEKGFGYDSVFEPEGYSVTFAEMELQEKNSLSHRARAIAKLVEFLNK